MIGLQRWHRAQENLERYVKRPRPLEAIWSTLPEVVPNRSTAQPMRLTDDVSESHVGARDPAATARHKTKANGLEFGLDAECDCGGRRDARLASPAGTPWRRW